MIESDAQDDEALQAFHKWRRSSEARLPGTGGPDFETTCQFTPRSSLEKYFERPKLENLLDEVLTGQQRPAVDADYVRHYYLQSFAILLCIGQGPRIHHFQQYESLRDQKLPHRTKPDDFPFTTPDVFEEFQNSQWQFCASNLEYGMNNRFKAEDILPIISKEKIGEGGSAIIYKIRVHENYNSLRPQGHGASDPPCQHKNTFVLKTYRAAEAEENYKVERDAYMKLRWGGKPSPHIIAYYGGFIHGNSCNTILEFADEGTLESFMRKTDPPLTIEENLLFWNRLFDVTHGILTIHGHIGNESSASKMLTGWHQDIKPANILVFGGNRTLPYDYYFKIADLGHTHFIPSGSQPNDPSDLDAFAGRAYGAPETFRSHEATKSAPLQVTRAVDIWSIGCVFSEVAVWAHHGWNRVAEFRRQRSVEVEKRGGGKGEYIFHYDENLLKAVEETHEGILNGRLASHHITRSVLDRLVNEMLQHGDRPHAKFVFEKSKRLVRENENRFGVCLSELVADTSGEHIGANEARIRPKTPPQTPPTHTRGLSESSSGRRDRPRVEGDLPPGEASPPDDDFASSPSSLRPLSSPHRHHQELARQGSGRRNIATAAIFQPGGQGSHAAPDPLSIPPTTVNGDEVSQRQHVQQPQEELVRPTLSIDEGHEWKRKKKNGERVVLPGSENLASLGQRDHIFLIDNSETMKQYIKDIVRVISLLAYMVKDSDKDGLDIYFTQTLQKKNSPKSSKLSSSICQDSFGGVSNMRGRLQTILREHVDKFGTLVPPARTLFRPQRPPQPQRPLSFYILTDAKWQPTDVGGLIKDLVQSMKAKNCPKEHIAIQFIRFGEDQASIDKLDQLDHGLGLKAIGMDIVDHTSWDGNVWKQLLGALNDWYDDDPT